jgi:hypothetical protein
VRILVHFTSLHSTSFYSISFHFYLFSCSLVLFFLFTHYENYRHFVGLLLWHFFFSLWRWFQEARKSRNSPYRDYYVWSDTPHKYKEARIIFLDTETSNWVVLLQFIFSIKLHNITMITLIHFILTHVRVDLCVCVYIYIWIRFLLKIQRRGIL